MDIAEPTITCPYNKAHSIISSRMQFHLTKCRQQYPNAEKIVCPFNTTHVINKVELAYHQGFCSDRIVLDAFTCKIGTSSVPKVELSKVETLEITGDENWNVEEPLSVSVLDRIHENSKAKPTLQALIGAPKSERKAFRNQERLRIQRVLDSQEYKAGEASGYSNNGERSGMKKIDNASGYTRNDDEASERMKMDEACGFTRYNEGSEKKMENGLNGYKNEVPKGRNGIIYDESEGATMKRNYNYSRNGVLKTNQGQKTDFENASVIQNSSGDGYRDPRKPWGMPKRNDTVRSTPNFPTLNSRDGRGESVSSLANAFADVNIHSPSPGCGRDPGNPWKVSKLQSLPAKSPSDPDDFPMLPVASRGRGRNRVRAK